MKWFGFLLFIPIVAAWGYDTHVWICEQLYIGNSALRGIIKNKTLFLEGCNAPDTIIKDQLYHNCYYAKQCKKIDTKIKSPGTLHYFSDITSCFDGMLFSCPALDRFNQNIKQDDYSIGAALHYYVDAFTPTHQITGEDYFNCHKPFEDKVDKIIKSSNWIVKQKCSFSFPCSKAGKTIRKCQDVYNETIEFSHIDMVQLIIKADEEISSNLNISKGNYNFLKKDFTGWFYLIVERIKEIISKITKP